MFNLGLYFKTLDLTKAKVLLNLGLKSFMVWAFMANILSTCLIQLFNLSTMSANYLYSVGLKDEKFA
jgi:hypothetical protein